ncbi:MAG: phosphohydrolase, partial [Spirochaetaceae bacterium]|nr:phosphohydrolase [Spirochaetaceae bacterium]
YLMYRSVYWHRGVRAPTAMVKKSVLLGLREGVLRPEELYGLDDAGFFALLLSRDFPPLALAEEVARGRPYSLALDIAYDPGDPRHRGLLDLEARLRLEEELARRASAGPGPRLGPLDLVVDLPEPVSFESDLPVVGEGPLGCLPFSESSTVFSPAVVSGFVRALRRVRVFVSRPSEALAEAAREALA